MPFEMDSTISIHAPREGGDKSALGGHLLIRYISIHAPREGGDRRDHLHGDGTRDFNPRPPRGGRLCSSVCCLPRRNISIHAPARGATCRIKESRDIWQNISIHAPREGGDTMSRIMFVSSSLFQSTPPARGATLVVHGLLE